MDLVVGGGKFGAKAARILEAEGTPYIVVDPDPACMAARLPGGGHHCFRFIRGGLEEAYTAFLKYKPGRIFPTAPVHVAAGMVSVACGLVESAIGSTSLLPRVPPGLVVGTKGGSLLLSWNGSTRCPSECPEPDICPATGDARHVPLHALLREILPGAQILKSRQVIPGLGAIRGDDLEVLLAETGGRKSVVIGTACRCHGVVTVLERSG